MEYQNDQMLLRYCSYNEEIKHINKKIKIEGFDLLSHNLLKKNLILSEEQGINIIRCNYEIPEKVKREINSRFNITYTPNNEEYVIVIDSEINIFVNDKKASYYAVNTLLRLNRDGLKSGIIYNYPGKDFRMVKVYLPAEKNIDFFKEFVDFCSGYGYNHIMIEIGGAMEYKKHPEINEGWIEYSKETSMHINQKNDGDCFPYADEEQYYLKNSIHCENGGGSYLSQEQVRELIDYCKSHYMEVIPEVPCLSHSDYLLTRHPELAERADDLYPDTYCPSNPAVYDLLFDVLEEIIEVFVPKEICIGHDEYYSIGLCDKCKDKDAADLFSEDINKIYAFLKARNIGTMMWCDKLIECVDKIGESWGGMQRIIKNPKNGMIAQIIPATSKAIAMIPNDIKLLHWYSSFPEEIEQEFRKYGYTYYFANFNPLSIVNWAERSEFIGGVGLSLWSLLDQNHVQKNCMFFDVIATAMLVWSDKFSQLTHFEKIITVTSELYRRQYSKVLRGAYVEITHATSRDIPHELLVDGRLIDDEKNNIGEYCIEYDDGQCVNIPIHYGINIGFAGADLKNAYQDERFYVYSYDARGIEPAYCCKHTFEGEKVFYTFPIPISKPIKGIKLNCKPGYEDFVIVKQINVNMKNKGERECL